MIFITIVILWTLFGGAAAILMGTNPLTRAVGILTLVITSLAIWELHVLEVPWI